MREWMQEHEAELYRCGRKFEPVAYHSARSLFGSESHYTSFGWRISVDCLDVPWFQPQMEVIEVDGVPVQWEVSWLMSWYEPLGIVKDIHIHW